MFEYLMPLLVMPTFANTLLDQTAHAAVKRQIQYGNQRGVPWGISECGYNTVDAALNYQYRAFGVPGLGLQRGLAEDLVIAPYASALALMIKPREACSNLQRLAAAGCLRTVRHVRGRRLHARALAARRDERDRALVHGPPSGHDVALARVSAARSADAGAIRLGRAVPVDAPAAPGARAEGPRAVLEQPRARGLARACPRRPSPPCASSRPPTRRLQPCNSCPTAAITSWSPMPAADTAAGGRLPSRAGARTPPAMPGAPSVISAMAQAAESGHPPSSPQACPPPPSRRASPSHASSFAAATRTSRPTPRSSFRPKTTSSCDECASPTSQAARGPSTSSATRKWSSPRRPRTRSIPAFSNLFVQTEIINGATSDPVHAPPARARRIRAQPGAPHDGARRDRRRSVVRNGSRAIHRPRQQRGQPAGTSQRRGAVRHPGIRAGSYRRHPAAHHPRAEADRDGRSRHRHRRGSRRMPFPDGKVPGSAARESRVRDGVDPQPGRAAPTQHHRSRCADSMAA